MSRKMLVIVTMVVGFTVVAAAQQSSPASKSEFKGTAAGATRNSDAVPAGPTNDMGFQERYPRYIIGPSDSFELSFPYSAEFNQTLTVQPDGFVTLKGVGDVHLAGKTVPQATDAIRAAYSKILKDPLVSILLRDFDKPYFIADGRVQRPGRYDLRGDVTVTEAIALAGGFQSDAKHSKVVLYRRVSNDWMKGTVLDVKHMDSKKNLHEDLHLRSGDMIFVPKNTISKIQQWLPLPRTTIFPQTF